MIATGSGRQKSTDSLRILDRFKRSTFKAAFQIPSSSHFARIIRRLAGVTATEFRGAMEPTQSTQLKFAVHSLQPEVKR
jgi:hypothetical protein